MKCNTETKFKSIYIINPDDWVVDKKGNLVRMKRKYGKFDRTIKQIKLK